MLAFHSFPLYIYLSLIRYGNISPDVRVPAPHPLPTKKNLSFKSSFTYLFPPFFFSLFASYHKWTDRFPKYRSYLPSPLFSCIPYQYDMPKVPSLSTLWCPMFYFIPLPVTPSGPINRHPTPPVKRYPTRSLGPQGQLPVCVFGFLFFLRLEFGHIVAVLSPTRSCVLAIKRVLCRLTKVPCPALSWMSLPPLNVYLSRWPPKVHLNLHALTPPLPYAIA